jgi:hypothetical protein
MSAHYLPVIHIPEVPSYMASSEKITEYIENHHHIGAVSHVDISKRKKSEVYMAFVHFKCGWNNGEASNTIRKAIVEKGCWRETLIPGFGFLGWLPKNGKETYIRLIKGEDRTPQKNTDMTDDNGLLQQMVLIRKLDTAKIMSQSALISQLIKELEREREKNRALERKWDYAYKTILDVTDVNITNIMNVDELLSE